MKKNHRVFAGLLAIVLVLLLSVSVYAERELPDLNRKGSITVTIRDEEKPVSGGALVFYQVAYVNEDDGNYTFQFTEAFASCGLSLEDITDRDLPAALAEFVKNANPEGTTAVVGSDGKATAAELPLGLYLVTQRTAAPGYEPINAFLVTVPMTGEEGLIYDVDASPKVGTVTPKPTEPPTEPTEPEIPYTGQTWWPVPLLAIGGLLLVSLGWILLRKNRAV